MPLRRLVSRASRARIARRRAARRVRVMGLALRKLTQGVHHFKRTVYYSGGINGSTLGDVYGALQFNLSALPAYTEYTALFDQYRINKVKVTFMPRANSADVGSTAGLVKFFSVIDYDDADAPTNLTDLLQYENLKTTRCISDHSRVLAPRFATEVYQSAIATGYSARRGWLDCDNPSIQHFGLKWCWQQLPAGAQSMDLKVDYYLSFKGTK